MAYGGYERLPNTEYYDPHGLYDKDPDDDRANQTTPFLPVSFSTPRTHGQQIEMQTMQKEKKWAS